MSSLATLIPAVAAGALAALLLLGERQNNARLQWLFKPLTSALFIAAALAQGPGDAFEWLILAGLALSWIGDVALIPPSRRWFLVGLGAFLLAHVAYVAAFAGRASFGQAPPAAVVVTVATSLAFFAYLRPHLGRMLWPVAAYVAVITLMVIGAAAAWSAGQGSIAAWLIMTGATLFYLSDITVALDRFVTGPRFVNRAIGLPLYYVGQFLLAYSIGA